MSTGTGFIDPRKLKLSVARLAADGYTLASAWHDFIGTPSTDLQAVFNTFESQGLVEGGFKARDLAGDISLEGKQLTVELDPRMALYWIGAAFGTFDTTSPEAGVFQHTFSQNRGTDFGRCLALRWTLGDVTRILRPVFVRQAVWTWSGNNAHVQLQLTLDAERVDEVGDPQRIAGTAPATSAPFVQGLPLGAEIADPDPFLHLQVTDISGLPGLVTVAAKIGAAPAFGSTTLVTLGHPQKLKGPDGRRLGIPGAELEVRFGDLTGLAVGDEWRLPLQRPVWTPAIPSPIACTAAFADGHVDGVNFRPTQGQFTLNNPVTFKTPAGSRFRDGAITLKGTEEGLWSYQRESVDRFVADVQRDPSSEWSMAAVFRTAEPLAGEHYHQLEIHSPVVNPASGLTAQQIGGVDSVTDTLVGRSQPSADPQFFDANNVVITTDIADPLA